jgi:hypothetical protein
VGLVPDHECYGACSNAWGSYVNGSLRGLITKGKGQPNRKEKAKGNPTRKKKTKSISTRKKK